MPFTLISAFLHTTLLEVHPLTAKPTERADCYTCKSNHIFSYNKEAMDLWLLCIVHHQHSAF